MSYDQQIQTIMEDWLIETNRDKVDADAAAKWAAEQLFVWRVKTRYPERKGTLCRVLVRMKLNSCLVQFLSDGHKTVTSRNYVRKV